MSDVRTLMAAVEAANEIKRLRIALLASEETIAAVIDIIGGEVEGHPTSRVNFLQRLRALVASEKRRTRWTHSTD